MRSNGPVQTGAETWQQLATFKSERQMRRWVEPMQRAGWRIVSQSTGGMGIGRLKDFTVTMEYRLPAPDDFRAWATNAIMQLSAKVAALESEIEMLRAPANVVNLYPEAMSG